MEKGFTILKGGMIVGMKSDSEIWIVRLIEILPPRFKKSNLIIFFKSLVVGLIPVVCFTVFYLIRHNMISRSFFIVYFSVLIWQLLAPFMIWCYEEKVLKKFFERLGDIIINSDILKEVEAKYLEYFSKNYFLTIPWSLLLVFVWYANIKLLENGGIRGLKDAWFWIGAVNVFWVGILTGTGILGIITTWKCINNVLDIPDDQIKLDPFHEDKLYGLSCTGKLIVYTILLFSTGAVFLPGVLIVFKLNGLLKFVTIMTVLAFAVYIVVIALSFFIPIYKIHKKAKKILNTRLASQKVRLEELAKIKLDEFLVSSDINQYLVNSYWINTFILHRTCKSYPVNIDILLTLIFSLIIPITLFTIQLLVR